MAHVPFVTSDDAFMAESATRYWSDTTLQFDDDSLDILRRTVTAVHIKVTGEDDDDYEGNEYTLTLADLNAAAARAINEQLINDTLLGYIASRDIDGWALDAVIQLSAFGVVRYG